MIDEAHGPCRSICEDIVAGRTAAAARADPNALRHLVRAEGLSALAAAAMDRGSMSLPIDASAGVRRDAAAARSWCSRVDAEAERLADLAGHAQASRGLRAPLLLKGAAVARHYGDPSLRPYVDIDLLVPPLDFQAWARLLGGAGYYAPEPEVRAARRGHQHSASFVRGDGAEGVSCDLHTCMFVERRARELDCDALLPRARKDGPGALPTLSVEAQLLVLALHLAQHPPDGHRLIWIRDFIEMGTPGAVARARKLAADHGLGWALELALWRAEQVLGYPAWDADRPVAAPSLLARVHAREDPGYLHHVVLCRELGPAQALSFLASRVDPRRFRDRRGAIEWTQFFAFLVRAVGNVRRTLFGRFRARNVRFCRAVGRARATQ